METNTAIAALAALAQGSRLAVFRLLMQAGPEGMAATKIADKLGIPPSSLSFHLKELTHAGMVIPAPEGRSVIYAANFATMGELLQFLTEDCCGGNVCISAHASSCAPASPRTTKNSAAKSAAKPTSKSTAKHR